MRSAIMRVVVKKSAVEVCRLGALITTELIRRNPRAVLGLATGDTVISFYQELIRLARDKSLSFAEVVTFNLDEYFGLPLDHPASYRRYMTEHFFRHVDIRPENNHLPDGLAHYPLLACQQYEEKIRQAGRVTLQLLGIGVEGHFGFVEAALALLARTTLVRLAESTRRANAHLFGSIDEVPCYAISMGPATILDAEEIILLATGEPKAEAIAKAVEGPITTAVPASLLQLHPNVTIIVDEAAGSRLTQRCLSQLPLEQSLPIYPTGPMVV
jgi:glucosamine-6-phosphate deaminase